MPKEEQWANSLIFYRPGIDAFCDKVAEKFTVDMKNGSFFELLDFYFVHNVHQRIFNKVTKTDDTFVKAELIEANTSSDFDSVSFLIEGIRLLMAVDNEGNPRMMAVSHGVLLEDPDGDYPPWPAKKWS